MASIANTWNGHKRGGFATETVATGTITAGDFSIDTEARLATVRGHELHLTAGEFDVLVYLTSHRKSVVTSRTTLSIRSGESGVRQTDFVSNLLSLRKKVQEQVPSSRYFQTEAWIVYDFHPGT
jgi:DNA-binding response OmpR family regulator